MLTKEMIKAIVDEVIKKIMSRSLILLVVASEEVKKVNITILAQFLKTIGSYYRLNALVFGSPLDKKVETILTDFGVEFIMENAIESVLCKAEALIVLTLDQDSLARIALGLLDKPIPKVVFEALCEGKKVVLCPDTMPSFSGKNLPVGVQRLLNEYLEKAHELGCIISPLAQVDQIMISGKCLGLSEHQDDNNKQTDVSMESEPMERLGEVVFKDKLMTAEAVMRLPKDTKQVVIGNDVLVTPLARDQIKARGIDLVFRKER
ncbi:MAG: flavoprotein [Thermacetogeniaceae bacterium]